MSSVKETVLDFGNMFRAAKKSFKSLRWKSSTVKYEDNELGNILKLIEEIESGTYEISPYVEFTIYEPKQRNIVSTRLRDRVFQRSLCDNYIYKEITRHFIYDNYACQIGKGTDVARKRMKVHLLRFYRKFGRNGYVLKCDIKNYFGSVPHWVAKTAIRKIVRDDLAYEQVAKIIDSYRGDKGIGLGSQVSQLIMLSVLNDLDHAIKERYRCKYYGRYMDDFIIISESKEKLKEVRHFIEEYLETRGMKLNDKKTQLFVITQPINFLGFDYHLTATGKVIMKMARRAITREKRRIKKQVGLPREKDCFRAFRNHCSKGNCHNLFKNISLKRRTLYG